MSAGDRQALRDDIPSFGWVCLKGPEIRLDSARRRLPALRARHHLLHHALSDALAAAELFLGEAEALSARGRRTLGDLLLD